MLTGKELLPTNTKRQRKGQKDRGAELTALTLLTTPVEGSLSRVEGQTAMVVAVPPIFATATLQRATIVAV